MPEVDINVTPPPSGRPSTDPVIDAIKKKEPRLEEKPSKLSMRLKRFLPSSKDKLNSVNVEPSKMAVPTVPDNLVDCVGDECWVDLPTSRTGSHNGTSAPSTNQLKTKAAVLVVPETVSGEGASPTSIGEDHGALKLEDLTWLDSEVIDENRPSTPGLISVGVENMDSGLGRDYAGTPDLVGQSGYFSGNEREDYQSVPSSDNEENETKAKDAIKTNPLADLQMDPVQKKRNIDFHINFPSLPLDDILIEDWHCALQKDILVTGRLYITQERICFHSNLFGWVNHTIINFSDIVAMQKRSTAFVIPNAILIQTLDQKFFFTSFMARDSAFNLLYDLWYKKCPTRAIEPVRPCEKVDQDNNCLDGDVDMDGINTICPCVSSHEGTINIDTTYPTTLESLFTLLYGEDNSFMFSFISDGNHDVKIGEWVKSCRDVTFVKPLTNPLGPKQTRCISVEEIKVQNFEDHCIVEARTRNPDVPSGDAFVVVTRSCMMRSRTNQSRLIMTTWLEWSKSSWFKGPIEAGTKEGTTKTAQELDGHIKKYIEDHPDIVTEAVGATSPNGDVQLKLESEFVTPSTQPAQTKQKLSVYILALAVVGLVVMMLYNFWWIHQLRHRIDNHLTNKPHHQLREKIQQLNINLQDFQESVKKIKPNPDSRAI